VRVLFTVSAWPGHWYPMVPLGWAVQSAGHEARVLCAPSQSAAVSAAGLVPVPVLDGLDMVLQSRLSHYRLAQSGRWPYPWLPPHPVTGEELRDLAEFDFPAYRKAHREAALAATARSFDAAVDVAASWRPDVVVHDRLSLEGLLVSRVLGVPAALHLWGPVGTAEEGGLRLMPGDPTGSFPRYGVGELSADLVGHVIDPCPDALRPPIGAADRLPVRHVPYHGGAPAAPLASPAPGRPRVCVVWGTSLTRMVGPRSFAVPTVLSALSTVDVDVLVLVSRQDADRLAVPDGVIVRAEYPLWQALQGCAAVVHHGGAGCTMTALAAGVPQLAVTYAEEQAANGERVAAAGAGRHVPGAVADVATIRDAGAAVLDGPGYGEAAARLRAQLESRPTPAELVERLAGLRAPLLPSRA